MKIVDAYILARTKRKTRRIRTALVTLVSGLLFAVLFFGVFLAAGVTQSAAQVKDIGYNSRYLTSIVSSSAYNYDHEALSNQIYAQMDAELRAKKVAVDKSTRDDPSYVAEYSRRLNKVIQDRVQENTRTFEVGLAKLGNPSAVYHLRSLGLSQVVTYHQDYTSDPKVKQLESQQKTKAETEDKSPFARGEFFSVEKDMLRTQLAPGQSFDWQPGQPVPVVLPYPYLEKLSGTSLANVDTQTRNSTYKKLIADYTGKTIDFCHRNQAAQQTLQDVITYNDTAVKDDDKKTNPVAVPVCGDFDRAQLKKLGIIIEPDASDPKPLFKAPDVPPAQTTRMQFKIVGFAPGQDEFVTDIVGSILAGVNSMAFAPNPILIPREAAAQNPLLAPQQTDSPFMSQEFLLVDFASRADQKAFIANGCKGDECMKGTKPFMTPFGNVSVAFEGIFEFGSTIIFGSVVVIMIIAGLMITFTISKVIADSSKEIAVFRALGARRRDIAQIYYTYGGMLGASALVLAVLIGAAGAYAVHILMQERFAAALIQSVGGYSAEPYVALIGIQPLWLGGVTTALSVAVFIGISIPVFAAIKRKLITILREE